MKKSKYKTKSKGKSKIKSKLPETRMLNEPEEIKYARNSDVEQRSTLINLYSGLKSLYREHLYWICLKTPRFVILSEAKELKFSGNEILRSAQNDKVFIFGF